MKTILYLSFLLVSLKGCSQQSNTDKQILHISYEASSRGFYYKVTLNENKLNVYTDRNSEFAQSEGLSEKTWKDIMDKLKGLNLETIQTFDPPSTNSEVDRAAIAILTISNTDKSYESGPFDHGNPPLELKPLIDTILLLAKSVE